VEEKRRKGWRGENGLWEKRENECGAVGEKECGGVWGRRSAVQWGRRMLCGEARSKIPRVVQCVQRAERGNLLFIGVRVEGFWGCSVLRGVRGAGIFGGAIR